MSKAYVRLHLFFATENDRAVILRQGPSKQYRMILWDRGTDTFEDGQWIKQRIYLDWCDLSPDGEHFIYFTLSGKWSDKSEGAYSVISKPPIVPDNVKGFSFRESRRVSRPVSSLTVSSILGRAIHGTITNPAKA